jgi:hypothetical protein
MKMKLKLRRFQNVVPAFAISVDTTSSRPFPVQTRHLHRTQMYVILITHTIISNSYKGKIKRNLPIFCRKPKLCLEKTNILPILKRFKQRYSKLNLDLNWLCTIKSRTLDISMLDRVQTQRTENDSEFLLRTWTRYIPLNLNLKTNKNSYIFLY